MRLTALSLIIVAGCATPQVTLVNPGTPVRLAEAVSAHVFVPTASGWVKSQNLVTVPSGWYCLPPPATRPTTVP